MNFSDTLAQLIAELPEAMRGGTAFETVLRKSGELADLEAVAQSWFEDKRTSAATATADIALRQHVRAGRAVQAGPFAPRAVFKPRQRRDQFGFGAKSIFVVPIERRSNIGQQRDVLILVLPIRTKNHSGGARGFVISESKIVGDCD